MSCSFCDSPMELVKYDRAHEDEKGPKLVYECSNEECELKDTVVYRGHLAGGAISKEQQRANYFRHAFEVPLLEAR